MQQQTPDQVWQQAMREDLRPHEQQMMQAITGRHTFKLEAGADELDVGNPANKIEPTRVVWPTAGCGMVCYAYGIQPPPVLYIGRQGHKVVRLMRTLVRRP